MDEDGWISVKDSLPKKALNITREFSIPVLIFDTYNDFQVGYCDLAVMKWYDSLVGHRITPTHWMPLPGPPK